MNGIELVVPCFNEADRLNLEELSRGLDNDASLRFLFVDDGSTDGTYETIRQLIARVGENRASMLRLPHNVGKAEAVRRGMLHALANGSSEDLCVGYWDADLSTPLSEARQFAMVLRRRPEAIAIFGSRIKLMGRRVERSPVRHYAGRVFATLASMALGFAVYDTQCGAKLFRIADGVESLFNEPFHTQWAFDVELLARLAARHGRDLGARGIVVEYPLESWRDVPGSTVRLRHLPRMLRDLLWIARSYGA